MNNRTRVWLVLSVALFALVFSLACSKGADTNSPSPEASSSAGKTYSGDKGTVTGVISFNGAVPAPKKIDTAADAVCGQKNPNLATEDTVVKDGKLANVFVYIKDGSTTDGTKFADYTWSAPATAVALDQNGCHYKPHVMGIQTNQKLTITNSDPTQHNIHWTPKVNPEWNQSQPNGAPPIEKTFQRAEILVPVKCNQHPWMKAYIGVMKHPFFAVSAEDGTFTISGVPAGKYTVVAWKEGGAGIEKTMEVTVPANGSAKADFAFGEAATTSTQPSSLQMMPAIEFPMLRRH
ncbi:MAG TPA: carboxypeptidase regulatory-like domain-containing protein [Pyrinomonadaceae bacterium]|nr:carboxypeptidase regulatory-like domain-containing protein [Pyrinomonadaceae bacterium]